jgi:hypothetical protein
LSILTSKANAIVEYFDLRNHLFNQSIDDSLQIVNDLNALCQKKIAGVGKVKSQVEFITRKGENILVLSPKGKHNLNLKIHQLVMLKQIFSSKNQSMLSY